MKHEAKVIADSISPDGLRVTTMELVYPRIIHAEVMTHRVLSRNAASSRAIPVKKMIKRVTEEPYIPAKWGKNQKGMQSSVMLDHESADAARLTWTRARDMAVSQADHLRELDIHKQWVNRLLEPFQWYTCIVTATEWSNMFHLRNNKDAHPDFQRVMALAQEAYEATDPCELDYRQWHLPYIDEQTGEEIEQLVGADEEHYYPAAVKISSARCARVSYLTHDGKRDIQEDLELYNRLLQPGHMSPYEHPARPMTEDELYSFSAWDVLLNDGTLRRIPGEVHPDDFYIPGRVLGVGEGARQIVRAKWGAFCGNFNGWIQHRKQIPGEEDIIGYRQSK